MIIYQGKATFVMEVMSNHARLCRSGRDSSFDIIVAPGFPVELRVSEGLLIIERLKSFPPPKPWWMWWWQGK